MDRSRSADDLTQTLPSPRIRFGGRRRTQGEGQQRGEEPIIDSGVRSEDNRPNLRPDGVPALRRYLGAIRRRKWFFLAPLVVLPALTFVATLRQDPVYEAAADVLLERQGAVTTSLIGQTPVVDDVGRTMDTQARLARADAVVERTLDATGSELSTHALLSTSTVFPLADVLRFTIRSDSAEAASGLASAYAREFVRYRRELDVQGLERTLRPLRTQLRRLEADGAVQSPLYLQLADRVQQLDSLGVLRASSVAVIGAPDAGDAEQVAPRLRRNVALAVGAGLVLSLVLVFLAESLTTRPRTDDELEELLGAPLLARIPGQGARAGAVPSARADAIHALRARLELANARVGARTIMFASPRAENGRTSILLDLALAYTHSGRRVAVVDLDFRTSTLSGALGLHAPLGLTSVLAGEAELAEALVSLTASSADVSATAGANGRACIDPQILAVSAGAADGHPAALLSTTTLASVLDQLEERVDVVLVDAPPILDVPDASAVAPRIDAVVLVVGRASSEGPTLVEASRLIDLWPSTTLGFVVAEGRREGFPRVADSWAPVEHGVAGLERERVS